MRSQCPAAEYCWCQLSLQDMNLNFITAPQIPSSQALYRKLFQMVSSELQEKKLKSTSHQERHIHDTKLGVCYQPRSPKVSCRRIAKKFRSIGFVRRSKCLLRHPGPPGLVSKESCFKSHLTHANLTLEMLSQEQNYVLKGKQTVSSSQATFMWKIYTSLFATGKYR